MVYHPEAVDVALTCSHQHSLFYSSLDSMLAKKRDNTVLMTRSKHDEIIAALTSVPKSGKTMKQLHEEGMSNYSNWKRQYNAWRR
jgi:hypothetical protein